MSFLFNICENNYTYIYIYMYSMLESIKVIFIDFG